MQNILYHIKNSGLSLKKLAEKSGITIERLSAISTNQTQATMSDIRKLSKALNLSIEFLLAESPKYDEINLLFRKNAQTEKEKYFADKFSYLIGNTLPLINSEQIRQTPSEDAPEIENTYPHASALATKFRQEFLNNDFVSPFSNLPQILSDKLNYILYVTELGKGIDGVSAVINGVPFIFISERFEGRMLFTLAHELGHILAHHDFTKNFANIDKNIGSFHERFKEENFANAFASCLLLPSEGVGITLKKIRQMLNITGSLGDIELIYLSRIYSVSFEVAAKRCEDMELIPKGGARSVYDHLRKEFGSPEKRAESLGIPKRPKIEFPKVSTNLIESAIQKINSGEVSIGRASEILKMPISEIIHYHSLQTSDERHS